MQGRPAPVILAAKEITEAFNEHKGESAMVVIKVKYKEEKDWIYERLWLVPGWTQTDIFQKAYNWMHQDARTMYYAVSDIEEARFHSFKLV